MFRLLYIIENEISMISRQTKNLLILFFIVVIYEEMFFPLLELADETGLNIGILELFALILNNKLNLIAIPLIFVCIMSGFPFCRLDYFGMIRMNKKRWLFGEVLSVFFLSFVIVIILFAGTCLFLGRGLKSGTGWGDFMYYFPLQFRELYENNKSFILGAEVLTQGSPIDVCIYSALMMWLYLVIMGLILVLSTIIGKKIVGIVADIVITLSGGAMLFTTGSACWLFPLYHMMYGNHYNMFLAKVKMPKGYSYVFFGIIIVMLIVISLLKINKMEIGEDNSVS